MAKGKTHNKITYITTPAISIISFILAVKINTNPIRFSLYVSSIYILGALLFSPDLDIKNSETLKNWGILKFIWFPYTKGVKHRSIISHGIIIGTLIRLLYIYLVTILIVLVIPTLTVDEYIVNTLKFIKENDILCIGSFIGLELSAINHIVIDHISTTYKKKFARR